MNDPISTHVALTGVLWDERGRRPGQDRGSQREICPPARRNSAELEWGTGKEEVGGERAWGGKNDDAQSERAAVQ